MTTHRPLASRCAALGGLAALCLAACAPGIDVGQATGTGTGGGGDGGSVYPSTLDFGAVVVSTIETKTAVVSNGSDAEIDGISATVSGPDPAWFAVSGLPASLAAGAQATVSIFFEPLALAAEASASVTFAASGFGPVTLALTGSSISALVFDPTSLSFGYVSLLTGGVACTTATNRDSIDVTVTAVADLATEGGAFQLATTDDATPPNPFSLPLVIAAGASAKVCFALIPPITQDYVGHATLVTTDPSGIDPVIQLEGWGGGPQIFCRPTSLDFGPLDGGSSATAPVLCTNNGTAIPGIDLVFGTLTTSSSAFSVQLDDADAGESLAPGQTATLEVTYQPSGDGGDTATLQIDSNGGQGRPVVIPLSGSGN